MKIIVAGSRSITDYDIVEEAILRSCWIEEDTEIVSGNAKGVDRLGEKFARNHGLKLYKFPADWERYGKYAGIIRNVEMANFADALIAVWDGWSRGTKSMIDCAKVHKLKVFVVRADIQIVRLK